MPRHSSWADIVRPSRLQAGHRSLSNTSVMSKYEPRYESSSEMEDLETRNHRLVGPEDIASGDQHLKRCHVNLPAPLASQAQLSSKFTNSTEIQQDPEDMEFKKARATYNKRKLANKLIIEDEIEFMRLESAYMTRKREQAAKEESMNTRAGSAVPWHEAYSSSISDTPRATTSTFDPASRTSTRRENTPNYMRMPSRNSNASSSLRFMLQEHKQPVNHDHTLMSHPVRGKVSLKNTDMNDSNEFYTAEYNTDGRARFNTPQASPKPEGSLSSLTDLCRLQGIDRATFQGGSHAVGKPVPGYAATAFEESVSSVQTDYTNPSEGRLRPRQETMESIDKPRQEPARSRPMSAEVKYGCNDCGTGWCHCSTKLKPGSCDACGDSPESCECSVIDKAAQNAENANIIEDESGSCENESERDEMLSISEEKSSRHPRKAKRNFQRATTKTESEALLSRCGSRVASKDCWNDEGVSDCSCEVCMSKPRADSEDSSTRNYAGWDQTSYDRNGWGKGEEYIAPSRRGYTWKQVFGGTGWDNGKHAGGQWENAIDLGGWGTAAPRENNRVGWGEAHLAQSSFQTPVWSNAALHDVTTRTAEWGCATPLIATSERSYSGPNDYRRTLREDRMRGEGSNRLANASGEPEWGYPIPRPSKKSNYTAYQNHDKSGGENGEALWHAADPNATVAAQYENDIRVLQQTIFDQHAELNSHRQRDYDAAMGTQFKATPACTEAPAFVSTGQPRGLRKEAEFLYQRLASGDMSMGDRRKAIEIIKLIEGDSPEHKLTIATDKAAATKSTTFNVSSSGADHGNFNLTMDMKMHDLTKSITKMKAFNKLQRMQQDTDRLVRIEEQLAKSKEKPKQNEKVTSFQKRRARELDALSKRFDELLSKDSKKPEQPKQAEIDDLKTAVKVLKQRCRYFEENIDQLNEGVRTKHATQEQSEDNGTTVSFDPSLRFRPVDDVGGLKPPSPTKGGLSPNTPQGWGQAPLATSVQPAETNAPSEWSFCNHCGTTYSLLWEYVCPNCGALDGRHQHSFSPRNHGLDVFHEGPRSYMSESYTPYPKGPRFPGYWGGNTTREMPFHTHAHSNNSWSEVDRPTRVDTVTSSVNEDRGPVSRTNKSRSNSPGMATPSSSWDNGPGWCVPSADREKGWSGWGSKHSGEW